MSEEVYAPKAIQSEHYMGWWVVINNGLGFQPYFENEADANKYLLTLPLPIRDQPCEWYGKDLGDHQWITTVDGWKRCITCKREYKPTLPDDINKHFPSSPMTEQQALDKARVLWGEDASIYDRDVHVSRSWIERDIPRFWVGCQSFHDHRGNHIYGNGKTWEAAFEEATERQKWMVR